LSPKRPAKNVPPSATAAEIRAQVIREHAEHPHPTLDPKGLKAHLLVHELVEKQLREGEPPEAAAALARLLAEGLERHQAVHAIGLAATRHALAMIKNRSGFDARAYARALQELSAAAYREMLGEKKPGA
jgi:hypothetical protein